MYFIIKSRQVSAQILYNTAKSCVFFQVSGPLSWGKWQASVFLWLPCTTRMSSQKESREFRWAFKWVSLSSSAQHRSLEFNAQNTADILKFTSIRGEMHILQNSEAVICMIYSYHGACRKTESSIHYWLILMIIQEKKLQNRSITLICNILVQNPVFNSLRTCSPV